VDPSYSTVSSRNSKPLERLNRASYKISTSDDPNIRQFSLQAAGNVFATESILSLLMACPRSTLPWDILIHRVGSRLFFDKRDNSLFDFVTVNETASELPYEDKDSINSTHSLMQEATYINQNFPQQILQRNQKRRDYEKGNPFVGRSSKDQESEKDGDKEEQPSVAYRYRRWKLSDDVTLVARCEFDSIKSSKEGHDEVVVAKALNEYDPRVTGMDWRQKLDSQRGAVLATELKNNSFKLARWTTQALLVGANYLALGYVSRVHPKDNFNHLILGTHFHKPKEFASQISLGISNSWGILKGLIDLCFKLPEGKYIMLKDPNKAAVVLYEVQADSIKSAESLASSLDSSVIED